jgi:hypothetical protein
MEFILFFMAPWEQVKPYIKKKKKKKKKKKNSE